MARAIMLAYDVGTSAVKCSMIFDDGKVLDSESRAYETTYRMGGIAEQNPQDWWAGICAATRALMARNPQAGKDLAAIGVSGHMLGCVPVAADGTPAANAMIHCDTRAGAQFEAVRDQIGAQRLYEMSGNVLDARSSICKILWLRDHAPEVYARTAKFLQSKDYVVSRLTGNMDTTDYSDACHAELMDIVQRQYRSEIFAELKLDMSKLPALHRSCDIVGRVSPEAAKALSLPSGIPVIAGGGDGACGSAGAGNVSIGDAYLNLGTTAWIAQVSSAPVIDPGRRVFNIMNLDGETCSAYGAMQSAGGAVAWVQRLLGVADVAELNALAGDVAPGSNGLIFLPYLDGERSPIFDAQAKGVFMGISQIHERGHFARAVFEGVAYALRNIADVFRERDKLNGIRIIGGGAKSELWRGIIADVCQLGVQTLTVAESDATSLGIAAVAGMAVGVFRNFREATAHIGVKETLLPDEIDPAYARNYAVYRQLYPLLKGVMHQLTE